MTTLFKDILKLKKKGKEDGKQGEWRKAYLSILKKSMNAISSKWTLTYLGETLKK